MLTTKQVLKWKTFCTKFIAEALNVFLVEAPANIASKQSPASREAHRRGLKSIGMGRWVDPRKPHTVVAKSIRGGRQLVLTPRGAEQAKRQGQKVGPTITKTEKQDVPKDNVISKEDLFATKSEVTKGVISSTPIEISIDGKSQKVRPIVDKDGRQIDVLTESGRNLAVKIIGERLQSLKPKAIQAVQAAHKSTLAKKWLGELGELVTLHQLLQHGATAYMLPDSTPKNDIVLLYQGQKRHLSSQFLSIKSTFAGEEANRLGSSALPDLKAAVGDKEMQVGGQTVKAAVFMEQAIAYKRELLKFLTDGHVGKRGVYTHGMDAENFLSSPQPVLTQGEFLKNRKVTEKDINQMPTRELDPNLGKWFRENLSKTISQNPKFSLYDMNEWLENMLAFALKETNSVVKLNSDVLAFRFNDKTGFDDKSVTVAMHEDLNKIIVENAIQHGVKMSANGVPENPKDQLRWFIGLWQRTRGLGDKDAKKGYLDPIINSTPTVSTLHIEKQIPDYLESLAKKATEEQSHEESIRV